MPRECIFKKQPSYVITYDFIFSNRLTHRITRHLVFWVSWWLYFIITFLLPTFHFPGYALKTHNPFIEKFGVALFIRETLIFKSLLPVILPQVAYTYAIISFALPRYLFKKKSLGITTFAFIGMMVFIYAASIGLMYIPFYRNYITGMAPNLPGIADTL